MNTYEKISHFNKKNTWKFFISIICLLLVLQCKKPPIVEIKSAIKAPIGVAFIEVSNASIRNVPKVRVKFIDPDDVVMSSNGIPLQSIQVSGVMSIGLSPKARFSAEKPYLFYIQAEADGYMANLAPVVVTTNSSIYVPVFMAKLSDLPIGRGLITSVNEIIGISEGTIQRDEKIEAKSDTSGPNIRISISKGTKLYYQNKKPYDKEKLFYRLLCGNPIDSAANRVFPGGFEVNDAVNQQGERIASAQNPSFFMSAGWLSLEMNSEEGQIVDGFDRPFVVEMSIPEKVIGPTSIPVKVGDIIPLWSLNSQTGRWKTESQTTIVADGNTSMKTVFTITHLSTWNLDFKTGTCASSISVSYLNNDFPIQYYSEYIREDNGTVLRSRQVNLENPPGSPLIILRVPDISPSTARIYVHDGIDLSSRLRGRSTPLTCTSSNNTLGLLGSTAFPCVQFHFFINPGQIPLCNVSLWYKESSTPNYFFHAGGLQDNSGSLQDGIANVPSSGLSTENLELRFINGLSQQVVLSFDILYGSPENTLIPGLGEASIGGVPISGSPDFTYNYIISSGSTSPPCSKKVDITINSIAITTGINTCSPL